MIFRIYYKLKSEKSVVGLYPLVSASMSQNHFLLHLQFIWGIFLPALDN